MDADLAFCLGQFIDDQVEIIDSHLDKIKQEEIAECHKIEEEQIIYNKKKSISKNKGSHDEDKNFVDQFIQELHDSNTKANNTKTIIDDQTCIDTLYAELSTKINACANYIARLRSSAQPLPNTSKFVQTCTETIDYFRQKKEFEINFQILYNILKESDLENVIQNTQKWWKDTYGSTMTDINRRNQKINPAITDNNAAIISPTNRINDYVKRLITARKIISIKSPKLDIIRKFVQQLLVLDEEKRKTINPDELIDQLNNSTIEEIIDYTEKWLAKRDQIRNEKEEDPFEIKIEAVKAEYGRRRLAQEAKKLALAALLCRLAIGSTNGEQFNQQLKQTVKKQKEHNEESFPVISGDIKEPEVQELPVIIQLELNSTDMNRWESNIDGIQEQFSAALCQAFRIPKKKIRVNGVERDKWMIYLYVLPPYGKNVIDSLNGSAVDASARMQAVRRCCFDLNVNVASITLGEFDLQIEDKLMDPRWNKVYVWPHSKSDEGHYWSTPINQGGRPYHCPSGWKRFGIKVAEDEKEFNARWDNWYIAYHGTAGENASKILTSGLKVSTQGCFYDDGVPRVYVSPSIEYCAHPRYARPWKQTKQNGETYWYQLVFQCRVNPKSVNFIGPETLIHDQYKQTVKVDSNFDNTELEWIILGEEGENFIKKDIICYGLMMRVSNVDPRTLKPSISWKQSLHTNTY